MKEIRYFVNKDKEELYINKKCSKGHALTKIKPVAGEIIPLSHALTKIKPVAGEIIPLSVYTFEKCTPDEFEYKICVLPDKDEGALYEYAELIKPTGAKLIAMREKCLYFRNKGKFIIPLEGTDSANKARYYRIRGKKSFMTAGFCFAFLIVNAGLLLSGVSGSPGLAAVTAGLAGCIGLAHAFIALASVKNAKENEPGK